MSVGADYTLAIANRVAALQWPEIIDDLNQYGCATASSVLTLDDGQYLVDMYGEEKRFSTRILMARHGFGRGEYKYGVIFAVHHRPVQGARGPDRVNLRHGVSRIRSGQRHTLGIVFHDAK